ncbi:MAG: hypothetical protein KUL88_21165 [Rhizobium sp.]|nr:hypothetical protein [Rhizobium sp.]
MADLVKEVIDNVVQGVLSAILKKTTGRGMTRRRKRQTRSATTGRFVKKTRRAAKPAKKQVSRRRTAANRSRQRTR